MKKLFLILAIMMPLMAVAAGDKDEKDWSEGAITWNDFHGSSVIPNIHSYLKASLEMQSKQENVDGKTRVTLGTKAIMNRAASYAADSASRTYQRLRYHQLQFDMLEVMRRRLQNDLNSGMSGIDADNRLKFYRTLYGEQLLSLDKESDNGRNDIKLQEWEYFTRKNLEEIGLPTVPEIEPNDFCYGMFLGIGGLFPTSSISDDFGSSFTFTAGLTGGYKRLKLKADIAYGQPKFKNPNIFGLKDASGRETQSSINTYASYLAISASLGYSIYDAKHFAITPHAGMYWSNYGWNVANYEWEKNDNGEYVKNAINTEKKDIKNFNWMAGIDFDIKLHTYVSNVPLLFGKREQLTSSVRITPFVAHAVYSAANPSVSGYHIGFTVSYLGLARSLHLK